MHSFLDSHIFLTLSEVIIGGIWIFHGLYSKLLDGIPRHRQIVGRVVGNRIAGPATKAIGLFEVSLGIWIFTGWQPIGCAAVQTLALVGMNTVEILLAADLLISAAGMLILNLGFLLLVWHWALAGSRN